MFYPDQVPTPNAWRELRSLLRALTRKTSGETDA